MGVNHEVNLIRILLLVQDRMDEFAIRSALKTEGVKSWIRSYNNAEEALMHIGSGSRYDLVLSEYNLPGSSGFDLVNHLAPLNNPLPLILLLSMSEEGLASKAIETGVDWILIKDSENEYLKLLPSLILETIHLHADQKAHEIALNKLQESEARYRNLFNHVPIGLFRTTPSGKIIDANPALVDMLVYPEEPSFGSTDVTEIYLNPEDRQQWQETMAKDQVVLGWQVQLKRFDGKIIWVEISSRVIHNEHGETFYEGSVQDITSQKLVEEVLCESEAKYKSLFGSVGDAIFLMQEDRVLDCNDRTLAMFGCSREEIIGKTPYDFSPPTQPNGGSSREKTMEKIARVLEGTPQFFEWEHQRLDGTLFDAEVTLTRTELDGGNILQAIVRDITERKLAEKYLKYHLEFEKLINSISTRFISISIEEIEAEIQWAIQEIGEFINADRILAWRIGPEGWQIRLVQEWCADGIRPVTADQHLFNVEAFTWTRPQILAGGVIQISCIDELPPEAEALRQQLESHETRSLLIVPLTLGGETVGCLTFHTIRTESQWAPELINLLKIIGEIIANALERKRVEAQLKESEARFRSLVQTAPSVILYLSPKGRILEFNPEAERLYGLKRDDVIGQNYLETFLPEDTRAIVANDIGKVLRGEPTRGFENPVRTADGKEKILMWNVDRLLDEFGFATGIVAIGQDITEHRAAEEKLKESEAQKALVLHSLPMAFYMAYPYGDYGGTWVSDQIDRVSGFEVEEFLANPHSWGERLHSDDHDRVMAEFDSLIERDEIEVEYRWKTADGKYRWFQDNAVLVRGENDEPREIIGTWMNITERKETEHQLKILSSVVEQSPNSIVIMDLIGTVEYANPKFFEFNNLRSEDIIGKNWRKFVSQYSSLREQLPEILDTVLTAQKIWKGIVSDPFEDGRKVWLESMIFPIEGESGEITHIGYMSADITDRMRAEEALRESEERFRRLAGATFEGIAISDDGCILDSNKQLAQMFGYEESEMIGLSTLEMVAPESLELVQKNIQIGYEEPYEHLAIRKDGTIFPVEVRWKSLTYDGESSRVMAIRDITDRKNSEKALQDQTSRLEVLRRIDLAILATQSPQETAMVALTHAHDLLPIFAGGVILFDFEENHAEFLAFQYEKSGIKQVAEVIDSIDDIVLSLDRLRDGKIIIEPNILNIPEPNEINLKLQALGARSALEAPLIINGELIGMLAVASDKVRAFKSIHLDIAHEIANSLAISIHQACLLESEKRRRENLELLEQVTASLRSAKNQEELLPLLVKEIRALFNADGGAILTPHNNRLVFSSMQGHKDITDTLQLQSHIEDKLSRDVFEGRLMYMPDGTFDSEVIDSAAVLPLQTDQGVLGALALFWAEPKEFAEEELGLFNTVADIAGIALQRLQILESLEKQVADRTRELATLYELAALSASSLELSDVLNQVLEKILSVAHGNSGTIHLINHEELSENLVAVQGFDIKFVSEIRNTPQKNNLWGKVIEKGESLLLMDLHKDKDSHPAFLGSNLNSYIGAPIKIGDRIIGAISIFYAVPHNPSLDDLSLLNLLADQIGIAVERSQLRRQAELAAVIEERQRLSRELHDAVTQSLYSLSFLAKASSNFALSGMWEQAIENLTIIQETAQQALKEMRLLIFELLPTPLEQQGLVEILRNRLRSVEQRSGVETELSTDGNFELRSDTSIDLFRIAQEALNNTLKHALASSVKVRLIRMDKRLEMVIEDNGKGFDLERSLGGMGINSMHQRAEKLGGTLNVTSDLGRGTKVTLIIDEVTT